jgi:uncharacterized protein (DUF2141 family)
MKKKIWTLFASTLTSSVFALTIDITGLRNSDGNVTCGLYTSSLGFPDDPSKVKFKVVNKISSQMTATCKFDGLQTNLDEVAVSVLHDEDANGHMEMNFIGIPKEGWATSNNAEAQTFGPPKYEDAKFNPIKVSQQTLKMNYFEFIKNE